MRRTFTALVLATALFAGCGGDDEEEPAATPEATQEEPAAGGGGETVQVSSPADGSLKFVLGSIELGLGRVSVRDPDMRSTTLSATSQAILNDGRISL